MNKDQDGRLTYKPQFGDYGLNIDSSRIDHASGNDGIRPGQALTMSSAEAIRILERIETDIYGRIAIGKAIDAMRGPWVKTSDRLPSVSTDRYWVLVRCDDGSIDLVDSLSVGSEHLYWQSIAPLPEVTE